MATHRLRAGALAAALTIAVGAPLATATASAAPSISTLPAASTATAFAPIATLPFPATSVVSPAAGTAYVAGLDTSGIAHLARFAADGARTDIVIPKAGTTQVAPKLTSAGGATWLLTNGIVYRVDGTTLTPVAVPLPAGASIYGIAADGASSLWVAYQRSSTTMNTLKGAVHLSDGSSSRTSEIDSYGSLTGPVWATQGHVFMTSLLPVHYGSYNGYTSTGGEWTSTPLYGQLTADITFASGTDYTVWGGNWSPFGPTTNGTCTHYVGAVEKTDCVAPAMVVAAATRLADGRVVLGGSTQYPQATAPGSFMVVPAAGGAPVPLAGSIGDRVVDLAAEPTGSGVWAVTVAGSTSTLQRVLLDGPTTTPTTPTKPTKPCHKPPKPPKRHVHHWHHNH